MTTWKTLGYLGLLPFIITLLLSQLELTWHNSTKAAFIAYSAIILSFIAGTLWRNKTASKFKPQQVMSNVFSLLAFSALLIPEIFALTVLTISYVAILSYEKSITVVEQFENYIVMRTRLTIAVVAFHLLAFIIW